MKKLILFIIVPFMSLCAIFAGCASQSQNIAKSLDDTITNLIYTVSSLDWADSEVLDNISMPSLDKQMPEMKQNINSISNQEMLDSAQNMQIANDANARTMMRRKDLMDMRAQFPETNMAVPAPNQTANLTAINGATNNATTRPAKLSRLTRSKLYNPSKQNVSQSIAKSNYLTTKIAAINAQAVDYSTDAIEENSNEIFKRISSLINKRATILVYLNPLYNGTAELDKENISAINAYINIIKDNNSYLKNNKGMVTNQLSQASSIKNSNSASPLINAYIIRTNEALQTRISKLDAALMAIDAISDILSACIDNPIVQNYDFNSLELPLNNKIITNNKNANDNQNECENCPENENKEQILQNNTQTEENESIKNQQYKTENQSTIEQKEETKTTKQEETNNVPQADDVPQINKDNLSDINDIIEEQNKMIEEGIITEPKQLKNMSPNQNIENLDKLAEAQQTSVVAKDHFDTHNNDPVLHKEKVR